MLTPTLKKYLVCTLALCTLFYCAGFKKNIEPAHEHWYLPDQINSLYLSMPYTDFKSFRKVQKMQRFDGLSFRLELKEELKDGTLEGLTYYFDKDDPMRLYQVIAEFNPRFGLKSYCRQKYGNLNFGNGWMVQSEYGFRVRIWTVENKLFIAGLMEGTEWEE